MPALPGETYFNACQIATANTNRDGTGTIEELAFAEDRDLDVSLVYVVGVGTVTDGVVRIFHWNQSVYRLVKELMVKATTPSATVEAFTGKWQIDPYNEILWPLKIGEKLFVSTHNAETLNAFAVGRYR